VTQAADTGPGPTARHAAELRDPRSAEAQPLSRRDRLRAATKDEILQTARRLLVDEGPEAVSLRAIAREMGMTAPGLYRYFGSREELLRHVIAGIFTELGADIHQAIGDADDAFRGSLGLRGETDLTPPQHTAKMTAVVLAACREFRHWALNHTREFALIFGAPLPGIDDSTYDICDACALQFAGTFFTLFLELWNKLPFPVSSPEEIDPGLRDQLVRYRDGLGTDLPVGAMLTFLRCWGLLYGAVSMEVFGHFTFALEDAAPMFELTLRDLTALVGLRRAG
jgi:AcrR family transcriptional regulator